MSKAEIRVFDSPDELFQAAGDRFRTAVRSNVALSGGSTPRALFALLAQSPYRERIAWQRIAFYWGDERCVPPDHRDSNFRMAQETLLSLVPARTIHRIHGEDDPWQAADEYEQVLPAGPFDLILLGMGPDGHTASLFPHTEALKEVRRRVTANYVPKLQSWRVTLTAPELRRARQVLFLVTGADKAAALQQVLRGDYKPEEYPSQLLRDAEGQVTWYLDRSAASEL